jgi:two-component system, NtrC family, sensor kinase
VPRSRSSFFWPLRLIVVLSVVAPALLFSYATWENHRAIDEQANERIERALDVLQEHALKAFQTVERSISEINEVLRGLSDEQIRASESDLFLRFKRTQQALPQIESIWAFDRAGRPLVSSTILPVPRDLDNSDRSYFRAQRDADYGTYIGEVVRARVGSLRFFVVSGRRTGEPAGRFNGVIGVTVMPEHFGEFYRKLSRGHDSFTLTRSDGTFLARFPEARLENLAAASVLPEQIQRNPEAGLFTTTSKVDDVERRLGYRKVPGFDVYVTAGIETAALSAAFWTTVLTQFAIGLPAVLAMTGLSLYALHRAQRFQERCCA